MIIRVAGRDDLPAVLALIAEEETPIDPRSVQVDEAYERAFADIEADARNEILVLVEESMVVGCLQVTYIPGLGRHGAERALIEAMRVGADRRGAGLGRGLLTFAVDRARARSCTLVQLTSNKRRAGAHRFYASMGFVASHEGFKLQL